MRKHFSQFLVLFGLFAFFFAACDTASFNEPQIRNSTQGEITSVQQWYTAQQAQPTQGTIPLKSGNNTKFVPDWKNATTILNDNKGKKTISVPLAFNGTENMNNREMYRRLLVDSDANGNVIQGEVVEFLTEKNNMNALKNEKLLVAYKENKLPSFTGLVFQYDASYKHISGKRYVNGKLVKENLMLLALPEGVIPPKTKEEAEALARIKPKSKGNNDTKALLDTCVATTVWLLAYQTYQYTYWDPYTGFFMIWWSEEPVYVATQQYICDSTDGGGGGGEGGETFVKPTPFHDIISYLTFCFDNVLTDLNTQSVVGNIMQQFGENSTTYNWILRDGVITENPNAYGMTYPPGHEENGFGSFAIVTKLSRDNLKNASDLGIASTILHESFHAYLNAYAKVNGHNTLTTNFNELYDSYLSSKNWNEAQHEYFATSYKNIVKEALMNYGRSKGLNLSDNFYEALAWSGLHNTTAFNKKYPTQAQKDEVFNIHKIEKEGKNGQGQTVTQQGLPGECNF